MSFLTNNIVVINVHLQGPMNELRIFTTENTDFKLL